MKSNSSISRTARRRSRVPAKEYTLTVQIIGTAILFFLAVLSFLPLIIGMEFLDDDPTVPYSDGSGNMLIDVTNGSIMSCTTMLCIEALMDSTTLYIPIKIAFPRFLTVCGVLLISVTFYFQDFDENERLQYFVCMLFAKGYFICGGLLFKMLTDSIERRSYTWIAYVVAIILYAADFLLHQWAAYLPPSTPFTVVQYSVRACTLIVSLCFVYVVAQLFLKKSRNTDGSYDVMSHVVVCVFYFGTIIVNFSFGSTKWKHATAAEIAAYNYVGLAAIVLFFFSSSHIAQRQFVAAQVSCEIHLCICMMYDPLSLPNVVSVRVNW